MADIHDLSVGQIVYSKCGRDKGLPFVVTAVDGAFAFLADGSCRKFAKPKRKKYMHLQPVKYIDETLRQRLLERLPVNDADFRKAVEPYKRMRAKDNTNSNDC